MAEEQENNSSAPMGRYFISLIMYRGYTLLPLLEERAIRGNKSKRRRKSVKFSKKVCWE